MDEKFRTIKSEFDGRMYEIMLVLQNEMKEMKFAIETMLGKIEK